MILLLDDIDLYTIRMCFICKTASTGQNSTGQDKTSRIMLENKKGVLVFLIVCTMDKKLSSYLVRDKNCCFYPVPCYLFCLVPWLVSKSNNEQKKLSSPVFLKNQMHDKHTHMENC